MDAIGQLTGGVAHDFNNLLSAIIGSLELVQRRVADDPRVLPCVQRAAGGRARRDPHQAHAGLCAPPGAASRADRYPSPGVGHGRPARPVARRRIEIVIRHASAIGPVMVDRNQLEMAVLNLAVNARDAMPNGGLLVLDAHEEAAGEQPARPGTRAICRAVGDRPRRRHGRGHAAAGDRAVLHDQGGGQGTGLGLSMVHGVAEQLGRAAAAAEQGRRRHDREPLAAGPAAGAARHRAGAGASGDARSRAARDPRGGRRCAGADEHGRDARRPRSSRDERLFGTGSIGPVAAAEDSTCWSPIRACPA